jgi:hypothetical protein
VWYSFWRACLKLPQAVAQSFMSVFSLLPVWTMSPSLNDLRAHRATCEALSQRETTELEYLMERCKEDQHSSKHALRKLLFFDHFLILWRNFFALLSAFLSKRPTLKVGLLLYSPPFYFIVRLFHFIVRLFTL